MSTVDDLRQRTEIRESAKYATFLRLCERDGGVCQHCGGIESLTIDHIDPNGGSADENLQLLCRSCNSSKGNRPDDKTVRFASDVWQKGFTAVPNVVLTNGSVSPSAFRVYALFLKYARESESCWPGQNGLSSVAGMSERSIRTAIRELEVLSLIRTRKRGLGKTNSYIILDPRCRSREADFAGLDRQDLPTNKKQRKEELTTPDGVDLVRLAWRDHAPPLVEHRDPYLSSAKATTAIRTALKIYPADVVASAVVNYATVLGSDEYRWSYQWTLIDFLKRGLDRFVPEAKPLERERVRTDGQARRTFDDLPSF